MKILSAVAATIFLFAVGATAETTNDLSDRGNSRAQSCTATFGTNSYD